MHFSFSAINENADENEIPFSAYITELSYSLVVNIKFLAQRKWHFGTKTKTKTKNKFIFRLKRKNIRKWPNCPFSAPKTKTKTNFGRLLVWWLDLSDLDFLRFYDRSTPLPVPIEVKFCTVKRTYVPWAMLCFIYIVVTSRPCGAKTWFLACE